MPEYDLIVIGSGLAGVHAACPPVENGLDVLMLDVGNTADMALDAVDEKTFEETRTTDPDQYKIFLGEDLSGIDASASERGHAAAMASGRRAFVTRGGDAYGPIEENGTQVTQSFARGGLSEVWSGVSDFFDDSELEAAGMPAPEMKGHYEKVIARIGVSGSADGYSLLPPPRLDDNARELLRRYAKRQSDVNAKGFRLAQPLYAMLTQDMGERKAQSYRDMDFWDSSGRTLYRARYTLEELERRRSFTYAGGVLVERVKEDADGVTISVLDIKRGDRHQFTARAVIVAAGAINTTRLLLRSFDRYDVQAPIMLKNYHLVPCLFPARLGKVGDIRRHSFSQLAMHGIQKVHGMSDVYAQFLSYNSLLLHKLLGYLPFPMPEALSISSILAPALMLVDIRFPSVSDAHRGATLRKKLVGDTLYFDYPETVEAKHVQKAKLGEVKRTLRHLGLIPLTTVRYPYGAPSHYAGGVPFAPRNSSLLTVNERGQVHGHERIFVGDASSWRALPAKPSGLTIMANASRVGECAVQLLH